MAEAGPSFLLKLCRLVPERYALSVVKFQQGECGELSDDVIDVGVPAQLPVKTGGVQRKASGAAPEGQNLSIGRPQGGGMGKAHFSADTLQSQRFFFRQNIRPPRYHVRCGRRGGGTPSGQGRGRRQGFEPVHPVTFALKIFHAVFGLLKRGQIVAEGYAQGGQSGLRRRVQCAQFFENNLKTPAVYGPLVKTEVQPARSGRGQAAETHLGLGPD